MIVKVMIGFAALLSPIRVVAATKPKTFRIQRSVGIDAPPEKVFTLIDNLGRWPRWAPQEREDPRMKRTYSGASKRQGCGFRMDRFWELGQRTHVGNGLAAVNEDFYSGGLGEAVCRPQHQ